MASKIRELVERKLVNVFLELAQLCNRDRPTLTRPNSWSAVNRNGEWSVVWIRRGLAKQYASAHIESARVDGSIGFGPTNKRGPFCAVRVFRLFEQTTRCEQSPPHPKFRRLERVLDTMLPLRRWPPRSFVFVPLDGDGNHQMKRGIFPFRENSIVALTAVFCLVRSS